MKGVLTFIFTSCFAVSANMLFADTDFDAYKKNLRLLTLSDPKPAIANIAGGFGAGRDLFYAAVSYSNYDFTIIYKKSLMKIQFLFNQKLEI